MDGDIPTLRTTCQCHIAHHIGYALGIKGPSRSLKGEQWGPRSTSAGKQASDKTCPSVQVEKANPIVIAEEPEQCAMQPCVNSRIKLTRTWFSHTSSIPCSKSHSPYLFSWDPNPLSPGCNMLAVRSGFRKMEAFVFRYTITVDVGSLAKHTTVALSPIPAAMHKPRPNAPRFFGSLRISRQSTIVRISRDNGYWEETREGTCIPRASEPVRGSRSLQAPDNY